jgi:hypothetical protein
MLALAVPDRETPKRNVPYYFTQIIKDWVSSDSPFLWYTTDSLWSDRDMALSQTSSYQQKGGHRQFYDVAGTHSDAAKR